MNILVVNSGSSSIKIDLLETGTGKRIHQVRIERMGTAACSVVIDKSESIPLGDVTHKEAFQIIFSEQNWVVAAVGHRVVHGGDLFRQPTRIDTHTIENIKSLFPLAPLHNPANVAGIEAAMEVFSDVIHVAVFDTAFHSTLPRRAQYYAIDHALAQQHGLRRYGFHGPSHQWVASEAARFLRTDIRQLRILTCHLGNGASICAVEYGRSVETSMGMTPLEGLVMGTRSGDIDPGLLVHLAKSEGWDLTALDQFLNTKSGLSGLSGIGNDLRDIEEAAANGDERARLSLQVFAHRLRKYIGAYAAVMGGVDAIVFTAGIGENSALIRHRVAQRLEFLGARIDEDLNRTASVCKSHPVTEISDERSRVKVLVVATDEACAIAQETKKLVQALDHVSTPKVIPLAVSARHVHLTQAAVEILFGKGAQLTAYKPISQPGQFACDQKVNLIGPRRRIDGVRVIGPVRPKNQVEISRTDEFTLGLDAPIRNSGDVKNTPGITLEGPAGTLTIKEGVICARRHIHMTPEDSEAFGVKDRDVVEVAVESDGRNLIFGDVLVRVSKKYVLEMHIDTDEANAAEIKPGMAGVLSDGGMTVSLRVRSTQFETGDRQ